ncbi:ATP-binding protein [Ekhidna sp.]|uniref:ATP-binding protein n=1 Tax=Ekhidna sp. TaxID=2608089 RepID=UPI003516BC98
MLKIFLDRKIYLLLLFAFSGGFITHYFNRQLQEYEYKKRENDLENAHKVVVNTFTESLNRFAYLMTGMRSHLRSVEPFPSQEDLRLFLSYQTDELKIRDSLIVSFLNTDHEFVYSFTKNRIDPGNLIGTSVRSFRNGVEIGRLNNLLQNDHMKLFPPLNLVEGWVGIPLNFPVFKEGKPIGYIASILNFRNIIEPIYNLEYSTDFVFRFSDANGVFFDREQVHDGTTVYHDRVDDKYFKNYDVDPTTFVSSEITVFDQTFKIGTAYVSNQSPNPYLRWIILFIYTLIFLFAGVAIYRYMLYQQLNEKLKNVNQVIKMQNEALQESNATKNRLMSIIGHDLKGPISSIINLINLVEDSAISLKDSKTILKQLSPVAKNILNLLENLLQWAMVNSDKTLFKPESVSVDQIVQENFDLLHSVAQQKNIKLVKNIPDNLSVIVDINMFSTIVRNLLSNAIKYSPRDSQVNITGRQENSNFIIEVSDQGIGMSSKEIHAINTMELEMSKRGTAGEKGTGLGLTLSKAFIAKHNGSLEIKSEEGKGSTFRVILPA